MSVFKKERLPPTPSGTDPVHAHTVLIVDDEDGNLRVLRAMLGDRYRLLEARDGREALDLLARIPATELPNVILSDQRMPRMTGVELFESIRERLPNCIRIIITGFVDVGAIVDAINRAGIYKFIVKPFDRDDLMLTVERAIETWELRRRVDDYIHQLEARVRERTAELEAKNEALVDAYRKIEKISYSDPLTGLDNRRSLARSLDDGSPVAERRNATGNRSAFLLIDVDHFKSVNDQHGHAAGDAVLTALADILRAHCRDHDIAARWGGEEFLLRIVVDDETQAMHCARRLRSAVAAHAFEIGNGATLNRTCSIGVACLPFDTSDPDRLDWEHVVAIADAALYMAKRAGRNATHCLSCASPLPHDFEHRLTTDAEGLCRDGVLRLLREPA